MGVSILLLLVLVLNVLADSSDVEVEKNVLGVLGEEVVLRCHFTGLSEVLMSSWAQRQANGKWKQLVGYLMQSVRIHDQRFSAPESPGNLTVTMNISSLDDEMEYKCSFTTDSEMTEEIVMLSVLARPSVYTNVVETVENNTDYQMVTCSAVGGKPEAVVTWLINGSQPTDETFSVTTATLQHPNGTSTLTSVLRLPTHLLDEGYVTCVVNHRTLTTPTHVKVKVQTFVAPVVTMETNLVHTEREVVQVVTCRAVRGRPTPSFSWSLPGNVSEEVRTIQDVDTDTVTSIRSLHLPAHLHEGQNVTCVVTHPRFPQEQRKTVTLSTFSLLSVQVIAPKSLAVGQVLVGEGQENVTVQFQVVGTVPRYQITCARDDGLLPADMAVTGNSLSVLGPVRLHHAGRYKCEASYFHHRVSVQLDIQVTAVELETVPSSPVVVSPNITTQTWENMSHWVVQCSAAGSIPAANVSWILPKGLSASTWSDSSFHNGTHHVSTFLLLPICLSQEHQVECLIEHPGLLLAETRHITLPMCSGPVVSLHSRTVWEGGTQYTLVECRADSSKPAAAISWSMTGGAGPFEELLTRNDSHHNGSVTVLSRVRLPAKWIMKRIVICAVSHETLKTPLNRELQLPAVDPPVLRLSVRGHRNSFMWLAVCESTWDMGTFNLSWKLPENNTGRTVLLSGTMGGRFWANSTYDFPLDLHEGQNLTCQFKYEHTVFEKTVHVPLYYISSLRLLKSTIVTSRVQNQNCPLQRAVLQTHLENQRIQLKVHGSTPMVNITCARSNGLPTQMEGSSLVFLSQVLARDAGLYTCRASYYHHRAVLCLQVELINMDEEFWNIVIICIPTACAIILILVVCLCVFCKRHRGDPSMEKVSAAKRESLAALTSLMAEHLSPELKKSSAPPHMAKQKGPQCSELVRYSIVIDIKTTV